MTWTFPTMRDALLAEGGDPDRQRSCDFCPRTTSTDMLGDITGLPEDLNPDGKRWMCDGCRERLHRDGVIAREDFMAALGAPPEIVARHATYAVTQESAEVRAYAMQAGMDRAAAAAARALRAATAVAPDA